MCIRDRKNGFFKLKADAGLTATKNDIEENPLNVNVDEVEAAQVPNVLQEDVYKRQLPEGAVTAR